MDLIKDVISFSTMQPYESYPVSRSMKTKQLLFLLMSLVLLQACDDLEEIFKTHDNLDAYSDLKLPAYSEAGEQKFACLMNGQLWTVFGEEYYFGGPGLAPMWGDKNIIYARVFQGKVLYISGDLMVSHRNVPLYHKDLIIRLNLKDTPIGTYELTGYDMELEVSDYSKKEEQDSWYFASEKNPIQLKLNRFDSNIASGVFGGGYVSNAEDSVFIHSGIFDVIYTDQN
jgi:hypothetical protein